MFTTLLGLAAADRLLMLCPLSGSYGFTVVLAAHATGCSAAKLLHPWTVERIERVTWDDCSTILVAMPSTIRALHAAGAKLGPSVRLVAHGGEPAGEDELRAWSKTTGVRHLHTFGSAEAGLCLYANQDGALRPGPGVDVALSEGAEPGRLMVRSPGMADSVNGRPLTGWYQTSDLAEIHGDRVRLLGRADDVVIRGGVKVSLPEVDATAALLTGVAAAMAGVNVVRGHTVLFLVLWSTGQIDSQRPTATEVRTFLRNALGAAAAPDRVVWADRVDLPSEGDKLNRRQVADFLSRQLKGP
jgi:acyl-coenzyme A synthetase/AMP-(fatty) acid ligase